MIIPTISLSAHHNLTDLHQRSAWVGKIVDFRHLSRRISETVQDRVQVAIDY